MDYKIINDFWGDKLQKCSYDSIKKFELNSNTEEYLIKTGIPIIKLGEYDYFSYFSDLKYQKVGKKEFAVFAEGVLEPVHIKTASKIIAKVRFPKYRTSSLS